MQPNEIKLPKAGLVEKVKEPQYQKVIFSLIYGDKKRMFESEVIPADHELGYLDKFLLLSKIPAFRQMMEEKMEATTEILENYTNV